MSDTTEAASQPDPKAGQISDGKGSNNITQASLKAFLTPKEQAAPETEAEAADAPKAVEAGEPENTPQTEQPESTEEPAEEQATEESPEQPEVEKSEDEESSFKDEKLSPEIQAKINKRIGKEVAKKKALEERLTALEAELAQAREAKPEEAPAPVLAATPDNPLADVSDLQTLQAKHKEAKDVFRQVSELLEDNPNAEEIEVDGQMVSRKALREAKRNAQRVVEDFIPQRAQFLQERQKYETAAKAKFSWLNDKNSPDYHLAQQIRKATPWIDNLPNAPLALAVHVLGIRALEKMEAESAAPKKTEAPKAKAPASQAASVAAAAKPRVANDTAQKRQVAQEIESIKSSKHNLTQKDFAALMAKSKQLKTTR